MASPPARPSAEQPMGSMEEISLEPTVIGDLETESFPQPGGLVAEQEPTPALPGVPETLLRSRIRAVALAGGIFAGIVVLFRIFAQGFEAGYTEGFLAAGSLVSFAVAGVLSSRQPLSERQLRALEYAFFGLLTLSILCTEYLTSSGLIAEGDAAGAVAAVKNCVLSVVVLTIVYGLLIPNDPRMTARVALTISAGPLVVLAMLYQRHEEWATLIPQRAIGELALSTAAFAIIGALIAILGAHLSNRSSDEHGLGQYQLGEKLGEGSLGEVYMAEHQLLTRPCALKLIKSDLGSRFIDPTTFERAMQSAAMLSHPNTAQVYDHGETGDGGFYVAMEFLPGMSVANLVRQFGPLPAGRAVYLVRQVCKSLSEAHQTGLIHRGLKPTSIFAAILGGECDIAKVLDFGLAELCSDSVRADSATPGAAESRADERRSFLSPEEVAGSPQIDCRADIYSLGAVLHFMLSGKPLSENQELALTVSNAPTPAHPSSTTRVQVPADLEAVVSRCLAKAPADRYPDARSVARALSTCGCATEWDQPRSEEWWVQQADELLARENGDVPPRTFGRYVVEERLGRGGMGTVYRAFDTILDIAVALKIPHRFHEDDGQSRETFLAEARALARLHHPHLCRIFDVGEIDGRHYISMALVDGEPLRRSTERSPRKVADLVRTIALALEEAHAIGVIHRDLKPANILLNKQGQPVVVDFNLAIRISDPGHRAQRDQIAGTIPYMSPEQVQGLATELGPPSDVYNLGAVLYELLTGQRPFESGNWAELVYVIGDPLRRADPPSKHCQDVDPALDAICLRAIEKDRARRFNTMREFAAALEDYLTSAGMRSMQVDPSAIRYEFVGVEQSAPQQLEHQDCLYLDAGNRLGPGVIDHRTSRSGVRSSTSGVLANPDLIRATLKPWRRPDSTYTISVHESPDLDSVAACFLAEAYLTRGAFPDGAAELSAYVDGVVEGSIGMSPENRYSLYTAFMQLDHRATLRAWTSPRELWTQLLLEGKHVIEYVLKSAIQEKIPIAAVDAFKAPGVLGAMDRREIDADFERYRRKLTDPRCHSHQAKVRFPILDGDIREIEMLFVRDVQNPDDAERCVLFKDWARSDRDRCPETNGFPGLCVTTTGGPSGACHCMISVRPDSRVTLRQLAEHLEAEESARRIAKLGVDDRVEDPASGKAREPRPGYSNADPWYDGRSHGFSIIASPISGTVLSAEEIEAMVTRCAGTDSGVATGPTV